MHRSTTTRPALAPDPPTHQPWPRLALLAAAAAVAANLAIFAVAARLIGVDVRSLGPIPATSLAIVIFSAVPAGGAALLAAGLRRWVAAPRRWFVGVALVVLALSFPPMGVLDVPLAPKAMLGAMHLTAAAVIVAVLAPALPARSPVGGGVSRSR
jgi:hypothetical protein